MRERDGEAHEEQLDIDYDLENDTSLASAKERTWRSTRHHAWPNFLTKLQKTLILDAKAAASWSESGIAEAAQFNDIEKRKLKEKEREFKEEEALANQTQEEHEKAMMAEVMADLEKLVSAPRAEQK